MNDYETNGMGFRPVRSIGGRGTESHQFARALRGLAVDASGSIYAVGDSAVKVFNAEGELEQQWRTERPGFSIAVGADGRVWVGEQQQVEIFAAGGGEPVTWRDPDRMGLVTAIVVGEHDVFLGDASARCIHRFDLQGGFLNDIGDAHRKGGFDIPNGVVDFSIDDQGIVHAANPGMHRVERYTAAGELLGHFGRFDGRDPQGFPGCCNPTNLAVDTAGRVFVTEKAGPRAKVYDADGHLLAVVDDHFDPGAKNMDIAIDTEGGVYVADTERLEIRVFAPIVAEVAR